MQGLAFLVPIVGVVAACVALGVSRARYYRAQKPKPAPNPRPRPARALSDSERAQVLAMLDSEPFMDQAPAQVSRRWRAVATSRPPRHHRRHPRGLPVSRHLRVPYKAIADELRMPVARSEPG